MRNSPLTFKPLLLAACLAAGALSVSAALAQDGPTPPPAGAAASPDIGSLTLTQVPTPAPEDAIGPSVNTTISAPPIPDSAENRKLYGGPDSAGGRSTAPQPGPVKLKSGAAQQPDGEPVPKP